MDSGRAGFRCFPSFFLVSAYGWFSKLRVPDGVLCIRVPYYLGGLERGPDLENYPYVCYYPCHGVQGL